LIPVADDKFIGFILGKVFGICNVQRIDFPAAGADSADQPGMPCVVVKHVPGNRRGIHQIIVLVERIGQFGSLVQQHVARHVGQHFAAVVGAGVIFTVLIAAGAEAMHETVVGADIDDVLALCMCCREVAVGCGASVIFRHFGIAAMKLIVK